MEILQDLRDQRGQISKCIEILEALAAKKRTPPSSDNVMESNVRPSAPKHSSATLFEHGHPNLHEEPPFSE